MSVLRLPLDLYVELRAHAEEVFPGECCGVLLGRVVHDGWQTVSLLRATNTRAESDRYEIAGAELVQIARTARAAGLEIAGFYHSHPGHPARWSATDLSEAHWLGCIYVITEVVEGKSAATNAFLLSGSAEEDKRFEPASIQIVDAEDTAHPA